MKPKSAVNWVNRRTRKISESGLDIDRARILKRSIDSADKFSLDWRSQLAQIRSYLSISMSVHTPDGAAQERNGPENGSSPTGPESVRIVMFRSHARALGVLALATIICELVVAMMLAPMFMYGVPTYWAGFVALAVALCIAASAHGTFVSFLDAASPLRQIRILRIIINVSISVCCLLLIPLLLSRVINLPYPSLILNIPLALLGLFLPVTSGACSSLRLVYLRAWDNMSAKMEILSTALEAMRVARENWTRELASIGRNDSNQINLELDRRSA